MESDVEATILNKNIQADILKVGHHGSRTATCDAFLEKVNPEAAVICAGIDNDYGHPHQETLDKLAGNDVDTYMTKNGTVVVTTDGSSYSFNQEPVVNDVVSADSDIRITSIDLQKEVVTINNYGSTDVDVTGWKLVSVKGNQVYDFPAGFVLKAGETVKVVSGPGAVGDGVNTLKWTGSYIWNNDGDLGELWDSCGNMGADK